MSILGKIVETVAHVMPDRDPDELIQRHRYLGQPISRLDGAPRSLARHTSPLIIR
jgi:xanthine dehydrogenase YagR molybdenum-binding subunit